MVDRILHAPRRWLLKGKDAARYSRAASLWFARATALRAAASRSMVRRLELQTQAYRAAERGTLERRLCKSLHSQWGAKQNIWRDARIGWDRYGTVIDQPLDRTIVLKAPGPHGERGVLLVMLEYNWLRLVSQLDAAALRRLDEEFDLVLSTGWSPTEYGLLALIAESVRHPVFVQVCNYAEMAKLRHFHPRVRCLPMLACDWINPASYAPLPHAQREIDLLMVANWAPFKRHWHLFEALARMPAHLRVVLIGQPEAGHTVEAIKQQARLFGVRQDVEFVNQAPIEVVHRYQEQSRASVILSRREGCCVAVCESLFADSPVGMLADAHVGPRAYINSETGVLLAHSNLHRTLLQLIERSGEYRPREWATRHISCFVSCGRLEEVLSSNAVELGTPWTRGIKQVAWQPYPRYVRSDDWRQMQPIYDELNTRHPQTFPKSLVSSTQPAPSVTSSRRTLTHHPLLLNQGPAAQDPKHALV